MVSPAAATELQRAYQLIKEGRYADALPLMQPLAKNCRQDLEYQKAIADAYFFQDDFEKAVEHLKVAVLLSKKSDLDAMEKLAFALNKAGHKEKSVKQFSAAFAAGLKSSRFLKGYDVALQTYVRSLEKAGEFSVIARSLRKEVREYPDDPYLLRALANASAADGKVDEAVVSAEQAYRLDPIASAQLLANLLIAAGRPFDVFHILGAMNASGFNGFVPEINHVLAKALGELDVGDVLARLSELARAHPGAYSVRLQLVLAAIRGGRVSLAHEAFSQFDAKVENSSTYIELKARLALISGDPGAAFSLLSRIWDASAKDFRRATTGRQAPAPTLASGPLSRFVFPIVYMPIEIKQREFEPRLLTAYFLAQLGIGSVVVAARNFSQCGGELPPGIVLNKTLNSLDHDRVARLAHQGHLFAALDEEVMAWTGDDWEMLCGVDARIVSLIDRILVPGQRHAEAFQNVFPDYQDRVRVTGNPRLDVLGQNLDEADAERLRSRYGDFVLVCTNFAATNSSLFGFAGACRVFLDVTSGARGDFSFEQIVKMGKSSAQSECWYFQLLNEVLPLAARACPDLTFVLRAHPGESDAIWRTLFNGIPNVVVDSTGPLQSWLPAARALVHMSGCATGLEAYLANLPAVRLTKNPEMEFPKYGLSHRLNVPAHDAPEVVSALRSILSERNYQISDDVRSYIDHHISRSNMPAAERMARAIAELYQPHARTDLALGETVTLKLCSLLKKGSALAVREATKSAVAASKRVTLEIVAANKLCASMAAIFKVSLPIKVSALSEDAIFVQPASVLS